MGKKQSKQIYLANNYMKKGKLFFISLNSLLKLFQIRSKQRIFGMKFEGRRGATDRFCSRLVDTKKLCARAAVVHTGVCFLADSS